MDSAPLNISESTVETPVLLVTIFGAHSEIHRSSDPQDLLRIPPKFCFFHEGVSLVAEAQDVGVDILVLLAYLGSRGIPPVSKSHPPSLSLSLLSSCLKCVSA